MRRQGDQVKEWRAVAAAAAANAADLPGVAVQLAALLRVIDPFSCLHLPFRAPRNLPM